ncbi:hypothetical protein LXT12_25630 [Pelomonas sp. P7]|uniref:Uncharacterized protein n=1 Tax=Pelomonas caseinilytica TaxID=2906763 RepID=A0ABS8XIE3_9BURK|nr:hypothetical protein [Pelomonas sp. P7]MCE4540624.1 hypothetical protein [Pelomonas sp. P7]
MSAITAECCPPSQRNGVRDRMEYAGSKPWRYLLVPHDEIKESDRLTAFLRFEQKA